MQSAYEGDVAIWEERIRRVSACRCLDVEEAKRAYKRRSLLVHPDKFMGAPDLQEQAHQFLFRFFLTNK